MGKSSENRKSAVETGLIVPKNRWTVRRRPRGLNAGAQPHAFRISAQLLRWRQSAVTALRYSDSGQLLALAVPLQP